MRIGVPPSSVNCLLAAGFLPLALGAETMRVPRPAAGMIATTFIAGCKYTRADDPVQIRSRGCSLYLFRFPYHSARVMRNYTVTQVGESGLPICSDIRTAGRRLQIRARQCP